jgi:hypothetical protein
VQAAAAGGRARLRSWIAALSTQIRPEMTPPSNGEPRISARTAALLSRLPGMRRLRVAYRADAEVYSDLNALAVAALAWETTRGNATANATKIAICPGPGEDQVMTPSQAVAMARVGPNAIRRACREGRIRATMPAGRWLIPVAEAARYARERDGN